MLKPQKTGQEGNRVDVGNNDQETSPYSVSTFYESYRWIAFIHRWNGLNFLQNLKPRYHQQVQFKFLSIVSFWCFLSWAVESLAVFVMLNDITKSFLRDVEDKFTQLITLLMVAAIVLSILSSGVNALLRASTQAKLIRDCSDFELSVQLPIQSRRSLWLCSKAILTAHVLYGAASLAVSVMMAQMNDKVGWKPWIMATLFMKIRLSALTITEFVIFIATFFKLCLRRIVSNMLETQNHTCGMESCGVPSILARQQLLYIKITEILSTVEDLLSPVLFLNMSANFFNCVCCVYLFVKGPALAVAYADTWIFFMALFVMVIGPCIGSGKMVLESQTLGQTLNALSVGTHSNCIQKQVKRFTQVLNNKQVGISASGFFALRLETVISVIATLTTYGMLLIQSHDYFDAPRFENITSI